MLDRNSERSRSRVSERVWVDGKTTENEPDDRASGRFRPDRTRRTTNIKDVGATCPCESAARGVARSVPGRFESRRCYVIGARPRRKNDRVSTAIRAIDNRLVVTPAFPFARQTRSSRKPLRDNNVSFRSPRR